MDQAVQGSTGVLADQESTVVREDQAAKGQVVQAAKGGKVALSIVDKTGIATTTKASAFQIPPFVHNMQLVILWERNSIFSVILTN